MRHTGRTEILLGEVSNSRTLKSVSTREHSATILRVVADRPFRKLYPGITCHHLFRSFLLFLNRNFCFRYRISWEYYPEPIKLSIEEYEDTRPPRRSNFEMILPRDVRQSMLRKEWDISQSQIAAAVRANIKIKNQRRTTVNNLSKSSRVEEAFENATRKVMKGLLLRNTTKELDKLEKQAKMAEEQKKELETS